MSGNSKDRRQFLKTSALGLAGAGMLGRIRLEASAPAATEAQPRIRRYNLLGRTGFEVSDIGIGSSRVFSAAVFQAMLEAGVNYIDTGESYGRGGSERSIGEALQGFERKKVFITSKLHLRAGESEQQVLDRFQACLERLQTDYLDCLMIHNPATTADLSHPGFHAACDRLKKEKKLRFLGVSNHGPRQAGSGEPMDEVLTAAARDGRFDVLLLIYNFIQHEPGERIMAACAEHNLGVTIMKSDPLGRYFETRERVAALKAEGGEVEPRLLQSLEQLEATAAQAGDFLKKHGLSSAREIKEAAIKFILGDPRVHTVNLAVGNFEEAEQFVKLSGGSLTPRDQAGLAAFRNDCAGLYCRHACGLCERACPQRVAVNTVMRYSHYFEYSGSEKIAMAKYASMVEPNAGNCASCSGICQQNCPYGVPIHGLLSLAHRRLSLS